MAIQKNRVNPIYTLHSTNNQEIISNIRVLSVFIGVDPLLKRPSAQLICVAHFQPTENRSGVPNKQPAVILL